MARARRRSTRTATNQGSPETAPAEEEPATPLDPEETDTTSHVVRREEDKCPACMDVDDISDSKAVSKEDWVRCDACRTWFHWRCAGEGELEAVDKWYCGPCRGTDPKRVITLKPPARKSSRKRTQRDYAGLNSGLESDPNRWLRMLQGKPIKPDPFKHVNGSDVTLDWLESDDSAMREPIVIEAPDGLGMKMPAKTLTVSEVAEIVGPETAVEVIDVTTQSNSPGWTLGRWAEYYETEPAARDKIRNVISLEISGTKLADKILPPRLVREVDWVAKFWPNTKKGRGHSYPKVQLYCLMGVADAWTDWHIDFAGSSVYYHILKGAKVFYFIRPTPANLAAYERWSGTDMQNHAWLGDMVDEVFKVELSEGNTMVIPTGWIHAVYTPVDTLVFGGNFLHSYNVATQLKVREIEIATHVPKKFRFPFFARLCWYAGEKYLRDLKAKEEYSPRVLESIEALADFLVSEVRVMERGSEQAKKEAKEQVPSDRVKDAAATARELRWRVRSAAGYLSDDDSRSRRRPRVGAAESVNGTSAKRKRTEDEDADEQSSTFRNFKPRSWESVVASPVEKESRIAKASKISIQNGKLFEGCIGWEENLDVAEDGQEITIERRRDVILKVRRTAKGLERQRVERIIEEWIWPDEPESGASELKAGKVEEAARIASEAVENGVGEVNA